MLLRLKVIRQLTIDIMKQRRYVKRNLAPELNNLQQKQQQQFDPYLYKKITAYYGVLTTGVLAENYCRLHGRKLSSAERQVSTWLGAVTPLFDDFFDKDDLPDGQIKNMLHHPEAYLPKDLQQSAIIYFYRHILDQLEDKKHFTDILQKVFESQIESRQQADPGISDEALWKITYDKGGYSLLIYHVILNLPFEKAEKDVLYQLGGILQIGNDLFDVYKDMQEGITTLPLRYRDFPAFKEIYLKEIHQWIKKTRELPFHKKSVNYFIMLALTVIGRCIVALDQLIALQRSKGASFNLATCSRKELICDMEKPANLLKSLFIASRLSKKRTEFQPASHPVSETFLQ